MDIRVCDICKKGTEKTKRYFFPIEVVNKTEHRTDWKHEIVDLCPECEAVVLTRAIKSLCGEHLINDANMVKTVLNSFREVQLEVKKNNCNANDCVGSPWRKRIEW